MSFYSSTCTILLIRLQLPKASGGKYPPAPNQVAESIPQRSGPVALVRIFDGLQVRAADQRTK